jgi:FAD:protein FMN transferase
MKNKFLSYILLFCLPVFIVSFSHPFPLTRQYVSHFENVLGTSFELRVSAESEDLADQAETISLGEIDRLARILSAYDSSSEFSKWMKTSGTNVKLSNELFEVLGLFDQWRSKTSGALDASAEAVSLVWKQASHINKLPENQEINAAVLLVKQQHWVLDPVNHSAMHLSSTPLMLNSFVKSYIISHVADKLMSMEGIHAVMVNIGGDIVIKGIKKESIRIANPLADAENDIPVDVIEVQDRAVATSGNYRRGFSVQGKWYSHIVDPRTGLPVNNIISATVVTKNATDAGALATAFNILDIEESRQLADAIPGTDFLIISKDGTKYKSSGWSEIEDRTSLTPVHTNATNGKQLQNSYELLIKMELAQFEGRFRRPFVAVWVENSNKETVRNLALWFNKPRWLPDLKAWYHANYQNIINAGGNVEAISSATRPPGAYTIKWDMKDEKGNTMKPGTYTIYIEAAREHGTYQLIKQDIECKKKEQEMIITGNAEISSASLHFGKAIGN